jgi:hypothetical protein
MKIGSIIHPVLVTARRADDAKTMLKRSKTYAVPAVFQERRLGCGKLPAYHGAR